MRCSRPRLDCAPRWLLDADGLGVQREQRRSGARRFWIFWRISGAPVPHTRLGRAISARNASVYGTEGHRFESCRARRTGRASPCQIELVPLLGQARSLMDGQDQYPLRWVGARILAVTPGRAPTPSTSAMKTITGGAADAELVLGTTLRAWDPDQLVHPAISFEEARRCPTERSGRLSRGQLGIVQAPGR